MCIRDRELAENLRRRKVEVTLVEMLPQVMPPLDPEMAQPLICLLYTSPSPRDGLLSIRRQRSDVYKRQGVGREPSAAQGRSDPGGDAAAGHASTGPRDGATFDLSLIHISEPTRRTPIYSSAAVRCV